jgi:hypothetical protein
VFDLFIPNDREMTPAKSASRGRGFDSFDEILDMLLDRGDHLSGRSC